MTVRRGSLCTCLECKAAEQAERLARPRRKAPRQYRLPVYPFVSRRVETENLKDTAS